MEPGETALFHPPEPQAGCVEGATPAGTSFAATTPRRNLGVGQAAVAVAVASKTNGTIV